MEYLLLPTLRGRADKIPDRTRAIIMGAFGCLREFIFFAVRFRSLADSFVRVLPRPRAFRGISPHHF